MGKNRTLAFFRAMALGAFLIVSLLWFVHVRLTSDQKQTPPLPKEAGTFLQQLSHKTKLSERRIKKLLQELGPALAQELQKGSRIDLPGLGEFELEVVPAHFRLDPLTGRQDLVPTIHRIRYVPSETLINNLHEEADRLAQRGN
jgi:nucleoid DNA-binding protein